MNSINLGDVRAQFLAHFESLRVQDQPYGRYRLQKDGPCDLYSTTDVAIGRTVMGEDLQATLSAQQRAEWCAHINSFAQPDGTYTDRKGTPGEWHAPEHRNGMVIGALGPLGGKQLRPVALYDRFDTAAKIGPWLETVNWQEFWSGSHVFWGGMHCFALSKRCTKAWQEATFAWLDVNLDPASGWWRKGVLHAGNVERQGHNALGGACHIWPIYQHLNRPFPHPTQVIDSILRIQKADGLWHVYGSYMELDALYGLVYMGSLVPSHRRGDIAAAAQRHAAALLTRWPEYLARNPRQHDILALVGTFGLHQQLNPDRFRDSQRWTDIFSDPKLYRTAAVEVL